MALFTAKEAIRNTTIKYLAWVILAIAVILTGWLLVKNRPTGRDLLPDPTPETVKIDSISPSSGPIGTMVTLKGSGFSSENNDIGFSFSAVQGSDFTTGYLNLVKSSDGQTITFELPQAVGVCAGSIAQPNTFCIELALILPREPVEIFVVNKSGTSNKVGFVIN